MVNIFAYGFLVGAVFVGTIALFLRRKPWHVKSTEEVETLYAGAFWHLDDTTDATLRG